MFKSKLVLVGEWVKRPKFILGAISFFVLLLRLIPISSSDIYGDNALNSFRAYGWFDWIGSGVQTTPFSWLGFAPGWSLLSFHDAPPLAFLLQNIFFNLFGDSVFALRLPFVLAGIGSVALVFFLLRKITDSLTASIAAVLYSFISYGVWAGHAAYLEGIEELFIVGSVLFAAYYLFKDQHYKYLYFWSAFTTGALLTKYTAVFLLPPIVVYLFLYRSVLRKHLKHLALSVVLLFVLLSPVIIYNAKVYGLRGHFDAALSSMLGMHSPDFGQINNRELTSFESGLNYTGFIRVLGGNVSLPLLVLAGVSAIMVLWKLRKNGLRNFEAWILCNVLFLSLLCMFGGTGTRFLSIYVPFLAMVVAFGVVLILHNISKDTYRYVAMGAIAVIFIFEFVYSFNTNFLATPVGSPKWFYSENKIKNLGFNQLADFVRKNAITDLPAKNTIKTKADIGFNNENVKGRSVVIYDDRINWFAQMWYMQRYLFYYRMPVMSSSALIPGWVGYVDVNRLMAATRQKTYFIFPINQSVMDPVRAKDNSLNYVGPDMARDLEQASIPSEIIKDKKGTPVFRVYIIPAAQ